MKKREEQNRLSDRSKQQPKLSKRESDDRDKKKSIRKPKVVEEKPIYWREAQFVQDNKIDESNQDDNEENKGAQGQDEQINTESEVKVQELTSSRVNWQSKASFDRCVQVAPKIRLKMIKRAILDQMNVAEVFVCRLFFHSAEKGEPGQAMERPFQPGEELMGEMSSLQQLGLANGGRVEVQIYLVLDVNVEGKGSGFAQKVEMAPSEPLSNLMEKFTQYRLFARRGYQMFSAQLDRFLTEEEMNTMVLKDSGLTNNSRLVMKVPPRPEDEQDDDGEEVEEFAAFDEGALGGEGGEDEMVEFEEGEEEMDEPIGEEGEEEMDDPDQADKFADEEGEEE